MAELSTSMQYGRENVKLRDRGGDGGTPERCQGKSRKPKTRYT